MDRENVFIGREIDAVEIHVRPRELEAAGRKPVGPRGQQRDPAGGPGAQRISPAGDHEVLTAPELHRDAMPRSGRNVRDLISSFLQLRSSSGSIARCRPPQVVNRPEPPRRRPPCGDRTSFATRTRRRHHPHWTKLVHVGSSPPVVSRNRPDRTMPSGVSMSRFGVEISRLGGDRSGTW